MPRFVLLRHEFPPSGPRPSHWDLMLERDGKLLTWSIQRLPTAWAEALRPPDDSADAFPGACSGAASAGSNAVEAVRLADHRMEYLDYEGSVSDGRGSVRRCDCGTYQPVVEPARSQSLALRGALIQGAVELQTECGAAEAVSAGASWMLHCLG